MLIRLFVAMKGTWITFIDIIVYRWNKRSSCAPRSSVSFAVYQLQLRKVGGDIGSMSSVELGNPILSYHGPQVEVRQ
jgi:hypothetical protein